MKKFFDFCVVVDCDHFFTSECLDEEHYRKYQRKARKQWQVIARAEKRLTGQSSHGVEATISENATHELAVRVELVDLRPIPRLRRRLQRSRGRTGAGAK